MRRRGLTKLKFNVGRNGEGFQLNTEVDIISQVNGKCFIKKKEQRTK